MKITFSLGELNQTSADFLISSSMATFNPLASMVQIRAQQQSIPFLRFSRTKTSPQYLWPLLYPQTSNLKHLGTQACSTLKLLVRLTFKIRIRWSSRIIKVLLESQIFISARAVSISLRHPIQTKTTEVTTMEIRCKAIIKDHILREESQADLTITAMDNNNISSKCSCK